jgi:hypothetical protein
MKQSRADAKRLVKAVAEEREKIRAERDAKYNPVEHGLSVKQLGEIWGVLIGAKLGKEIGPLPPELVHHMFAAQKIHRATVDDHYDHYADCAVYNDLALEEALVHAIERDEVDEFMRREMH